MTQKYKVDSMLGLEKMPVILIPSYFLCKGLPVGKLRKEEEYQSLS